MTRKIHVQAVPVRWGCRRWSSTLSPHRPEWTREGVTLMLGRVEFAAWYGGLFVRPWRRPPRLWIGKGAGFTQVSWWHFTVHVEIDPISWSVE